MVRNDFLVTTVLAMAITVGIAAHLIYSSKSAVQVNVVSQERAAISDKALSAGISPGAGNKLRRASSILLEDVSVMVVNSI
ncbi:MAG: hypothetical protein A3G18_10900 [Rhodospirillales bacterium RIFCSPLOWO2_12_FULL_58_28]|nr:MAG: hypothetical protein A3H92_11255 [Rhodospirillales bacterium RIFCSPLOWO2_02_FULL_58_16]OHC77925.1 MAG: hypothetical protein A3G18_10900 [Rhodospirillales bacterium RIFCSPLOWO2_12_FULL_58_28]